MWCYGRHMKEQVAWIILGALAAGVMSVFVHLILDARLDSRMDRIEALLDGRSDPPGYRIPRVGPSPTDARLSALDERLSRHIDRYLG